MNLFYVLCLSLTCVCSYRMSTHKLHMNILDAHKWYVIGETKDITRVNQKSNSQ